MYVLALSDYKQMLKTCCCRGLQTRPPIRPTNCSLSNIYPYVFKTFDLSFMFHFMFQLIDYQSFQKVKHTIQMFHFQFHVSLFKTLRERFHAPSVFLNRSHSVFVFLPQCFQNETLKPKMKHKSRMFQPSKELIINRLKHKNET